MFLHIVSLNHVLSKEDRVFEKDPLSNLFKIFLILRTSKTINLFKKIN